MKNQSSKRKVQTGLIITAFAAAAIIYAAMIIVEKKTLAAEGKTEVFSVVKEIPEETVINAENWDEYIEIKDMYVSAIPADRVMSKQDAEGMVTRINIPEGTILTSDMLRKPEIGNEGMNEPVLLGFKADDIYQVIGGKLRTGDLVHIYIVDEEGNTILRWSNVTIEEAFDSSGNTLGKNDEGKALRFNIFMEKSDAPEFYNLLDSEKIRIVRVSTL